MQDNLHNQRTSNVNISSINMLPSLEEIRRNNSKQQSDITTELTQLPIDKKKNNILDLNTIITIERILEIVLKIVIVIFIGFFLTNQISFFKELILGVAKENYKLDSTTLQIVSSALIIEFIFAMRIVINSLFPESDRKNSLEFMKNKSTNDESKSSQQSCDSTN